MSAVLPFWFTLFAAATIFSVMLSLGLRLGREQIAAALQRRMVLGAIVFAVVVPVPVLAVIFVKLLGLQGPVAAGIVLMAISPGAPVALRRAIDVGGRAEFAPALHLAIVIFAVVTVPFSVYVMDMIFGAGFAVTPWHIARQVFFAQLLPLALGAAFRAWFPAAAARLEPRLARFANLLLLALLVTCVWVLWPLLAEIGWMPFVAGIVLTACALLVGAAFAGRDAAARPAGAVAAAMRNPGLALLIATVNQAPTSVTAAVFGYALGAVAVVTAFVVWWTRGRGQGVKASPGGTPVEERPRDAGVRRGSLKRVAYAGAGGVLLLAAAAAGVAYLADTGAARRAIERRISDSVTGEVRYDSLALRLFPSPRAEIHGIAFRIPGVAEGRAAAIHVRLALLPLLAGDVRPTSIRIEQPVVTVPVTPTAEAGAFETYRAAVGPAVEALVRRAAGATITIAGGRLAIDDAGRRLYSLAEVECEVVVSGDAVTAKASTTADEWRSARVRLRIAADSLAASGTLEVEGFNAAQLLGPGDAGDALRVRPGPVDGNLGFETDGRARMRVTLTAATPQLTLARGARTSELGAVHGSGELLREGSALTVTVRDLSAGELLRGASGVLRANVEGAAPSFELKAASFDFAKWHAVASALLGAEDRMSAWIHSLSAGTLRDISISSEGVGLHELIGRRAVRAEATLEAARLAVPAAGIDVRNGSGRFQLADGVLRGSELAGEFGRSTFRSGALALELVPGVRLRVLAAAVGADLGDALSITRRLLGKHEPAALAAIEALAGRAEGKIDYDARRGAEPLIVELAKMRATGRHRGTPLSLAVRGGDLRYSGSVLRVRGLDAGVGRSTVQRMDVELALGPAALIRSASGNAVLVLDEVYPWLPKTALQELRLGDLRAMAGVARVRLVRLSGPPARPAALDFEATIEPDGIRIDAAAVPAPLSVTGGTFVLTARALKFDRVAFAAGDSRVTLSGSIDDHSSAARRAELAIEQGTLGAAGIAWAWARGGLPPVAIPRAPLEVPAARVQWPGQDAAPRAAQGRVRVGGAVEADFDVAWQPGALDLKRLAVKDSDTDATAAVHWSPGALRIAFDGSFDGRTVARALPNAGFEKGSVRGEMRAALNPREPHRSSATGTLEIAGVDLSKQLGLPVAFERVRVEARERMLRVHEGRLIVQGQPLEANGTVEGGESALAIDGTVNARTLDLVRLLRDFTRMPQSATPPQPRQLKWDLPLVGRIGISAESLVLGGHSLREVRGSLALAANRITAEIAQARLCGVTTPFTAVLEPEGLEAKLRPQARGQPLADALPCLTRNTLAASGSYDLDGELALAGPYASPFRSLAGKFSLTARNGRIQRAEALHRAIALDEVAKRMEAPPSKLMAEGLAYDEIAASGSIAAGSVRLDRVVLDSPTLGATLGGDIALVDGRLALQGLFAPIDALHRNLRRVPVLGRTFGSLVVVPVTIGGTVSDPEVRVMAAQAVGATLINLMAARFLLPINVFDITGAGLPRTP